MSIANTNQYLAKDLPYTSCSIKGNNNNNCYYLFIHQIFLDTCSVLASDLTTVI